MSLSFTCPGCREPITVKYLKVGEMAKCLSCGLKTSVPADAQVDEQGQEEQNPDGAPPGDAFTQSFRQEP